MSTVHLIDTITKWAGANICSQIKLKVPPPAGDAVDDGYEYKLATPAAFPMYIPSSDKLPPSIPPFPSLCVYLLNGDDTLATGHGGANIQFLFSAWDPGLHNEDIFLPDGNGNFNRWENAAAERYFMQTGEAAHTFFRRTGEGWRDAWNFVDIALRKLESTTNIGGLVIDRDTPIKYGPVAEQEAVSDLYPNWFAWVSFRVNYPLMRNNEEIRELL